MVDFHILSDAWFEMAEINRKMLADWLLTDAATFTALADAAKQNGK